MAQKNGFNRRDFLKIISASAGLAAGGCVRELPEKMIPYVVQPDEVVPGVATWYSGACGECSAGCGILVRTREGRAVKLEGLPEHPVNQGGLCAHGQSALQGHYDPDRIREPLKREVSGTFAPVAWKDGLGAFAQAVADASQAGAATVLLTAPTSGSEKALIKEFAGKVAGFQHMEFELSGQDVVDVAAEQVFGAGARTDFDFEKAEVIVSFGADYLETWLSPVRFARGWAAGRKRAEVSRVIHVEPRLSLTAGNADQWVRNNPGSETRIQLALLKMVVDKAGAKVSGAARQKIDAVLSSSMVGGQDTNKLLAQTGVSSGLLEKIAEELLKRPSLVVAGGASVSGEQAIPAAVLANLLNLATGNIGTTVRIFKSEQTKTTTSYQALVQFFSDVADKKKKVGTLIVSGVNPAYLLPASAKFQDALRNIGTLIAVSTQLDETTNLANIVLPKSSSLESWGDSEPLPGIYNLSQPAMQPLYKTQSLGDTLIALAAVKAIGKPFPEMASFVDYMKAQWKTRTGESGFDARWLGYVEKGGDWSKPEAPQKSFTLASGNDADLAKSVQASLNNTLLAATLKSGLEVKGDKKLQLLVYPSVNSFDGTSANRSWMQELPNPMTSAVWGSWIEMHPDTAAQYGFEKAEVVQLVTDAGAIEAPLYPNKYIAPSLVAVPLGQGHETYGRFAAGVGVNPLRLLAASAALAPQLVATGVTVRKSLSKETLVLLQGKDVQAGRGVIRSISAAKLAAHGDHGHGEHGQAEHGHGEHAEHGAPHNPKLRAGGAEDLTKEFEGKEGGGHEGGHEDLLALGPRKEPLQMYKQMDHPLYRWGMTIDLAACTGCSACVVACYAENNVPVVGKTVCDEGREMSWIHVERFFDGPDEQPVDGFMPMMCQHCGNAPCEPVCPVYGTYHTDEGLNSMVYNRCVGTRYCANNCSYKVRRFNWYKYNYPEPLTWQLNPDVTVREVGVMEKCSFCIQRIREVQSNAKDEGRMVEDGEVKTACAQSCPTQAIRFGNLLDPESQVAKDRSSPRSYRVLDAELNTQPATTYLARIKNDPLTA